jgi:DNA-binding transcriptional ArsR family regulator
MDLALYAIAEPRRRSILRLLQEREMSAGEIAAQYAQEVTGPAISQHLRVLLDAELVSVRREGTKRLYRARPEKLAEVRGFLDQFWGDSLSQLKQAAEAEEKGIKKVAQSKPRRART